MMTMTTTKLMPEPPEPTPEPMRPLLVPRAADDHGPLTPIEEALVEALASAFLRQHAAKRQLP